ncbi:hypothetical protein LPJ81_002314 [Coemansia sp. IMI 209127]|nr:hypothetical protein LPJ81_002314 [Coemansia sp. IMI 209127]
MVGMHAETVYSRQRRRRRSFGVQEYELLPIDYVQGQADMSFAFFFDAPARGTQHPSTRTLHESLVRAIQVFPILTGHLTSRKERSHQWTVVVDSSRINWPVLSESQAAHGVFAQAMGQRFQWSQWPPETQNMVGLHSIEGQPLFGLHVVRYACGALSIHTRMRHQIMDGCGLFRFYSTWAQMCAHIHHSGGRSPMRLSVAEYPLCDRLICASRIVGADGVTRQNIQGPKGTAAPCKGAAASRVFRYMAKLEVFLRRLSRYRNAAAAEADPQLPAQMHRFAVSPDALRELKSRFGAVSSCTRGTALLRRHRAGHVTTNDLLLALFWRAITRAHAKVEPSDPYTCMSIACDMRKRIAVPATYTGNASFPLPMHMAKQTMLTHSVTDTAAYIRYHVDLLSPEFARQMSALLASDKMMARLVAMFHPRTAFFMASALAAFPMYQSLDFGANMPAHIDIPPYLAPGFSIWLPSSPQDNIFRPSCILMNIALRDDVFHCVVRDPEFRTFVTVLC